ncbi:hypothetical protein SteCoe_253 [Stentor coeruleus]|uniref:Uncharacterized protein n=1 Tax=Stentor coeruleus TaxID=5963 RepID=A0A1R2D4U5_9CILI|nr:hypothetical protein SteCoe_253 [Stentor coeruleus]
MGCCSSKYNAQAKGLDVLGITEAIDKNRLGYLTKLKKRFFRDPKNQGLVDENFISIGDMNISLLGYALLNDRFKAFKHLHCEIGASLNALDALLEKHNTSIIEFICTKGLVQFLHYYLPIYERNQLEKKNKEPNCVATFEFNQTFALDGKMGRILTPMQLAVEKDHINIVNFILEYYDKKENIPNEFNVNYQDEIAGQNCAMIACRKGSFTMVKYLFEHCKADFHSVNLRNENVLVITAAASKLNKKKDHFKVFAYLIETVKVDFYSVYEDIMLLLEDEMIIHYFQTILEHYGIKESKSFIEGKFKINNLIPQSFIQTNDISSNDIQFSNIIIDDENKQSVLSDIKSDERMTVFFASVLSYFDRSN